MHAYELAVEIAKHMPGYMAGKLPDSEGYAKLERVDGKSTFPQFLLMAGLQNGQSMIIHNRPLLIDHATNTTTARPGYVTSMGFMLLPPDCTGKQAALRLKHIWPALEHQHRLDLGWVAEQEAQAVGFKVPVMLQAEWIHQGWDRPTGEARAAYIAKYCV
jgi:hypothetical protein